MSLKCVLVGMGFKKPPLIYPVSFCVQFPLRLPLLFPVPSSLLFPLPLTFHALPDYNDGMTKRAIAASRAARYAAPRTRRSPVKKWIKTLFALAFLLVEIAIAIALVVTVVVFYRFTRQDLPGIEAIATDIRTPVPTTIWSQDGVRSEEHT